MLAAAIGLLTYLLSLTVKDFIIIKTIAMTKKRNLRKVKTYGFKKKKVVAKRKKLRKIGPSCRLHDKDWVSEHTQWRRTGLMIRKMKRLAQNPQQA